MFYLKRRKENALTATPLPSLLLRVISNLDPGVTRCQESDSHGALIY